MPLTNFIPGHNMIEMNFYKHLGIFLGTALLGLFISCRNYPSPASATEVEISTLEDYVANRAVGEEWNIVDSVRHDDYTTYILHMVSQNWLTEVEVKDPRWWHWLTVVIPDSLQNETAMLLIGGGSRQTEQPADANDRSVQMALKTYTAVADLHNVPNQPLEFVNDPYGPRDEDEIIAYGWKKFLEGGAKNEDIRWLARMPMTTAAVVAMDILEKLGKEKGKTMAKFVVAGGSKRGWTTWTTGAVDSRVVAIAPIVIDMLNVVPSFEHHWRAYGKWAPAVDDYVDQGIMEWQNSIEYAKLIGLTEPYSFRAKLNMPKMLFNATGDQFFLPDSWQFYWNELQGEKLLRYVPNSDHSMRETDVWLTLVTFHKMIVEGQPRPDFEWSVEGDAFKINTGVITPDSIKLWQAHNPKARNFQVDSIGRAYRSTNISIESDGEYQIALPQNDQGWTASFVELAYHERSGLPLKVTTGVVVRPDIYPYEPYVSDQPLGTMVD